MQNKKEQGFSNKIAHIRLSKTAEDQSDKKEYAEEQPLEVHLFGVKNLAGKSASKFGLEACGELVGLLHDLGKASNAFQEYIRLAASGEKTSKKVDHATAGARILYERYYIREGKAHRTLQACVDEEVNLCIEILINVIISHHSGLYSFVSRHRSDELEGRLMKNPEDMHYAEAEEYLNGMLPPEELDRMLERACTEFSSFYSGIKEKEEYLMIQLSLLTKILFSSLVDADWTDSLLFEEGKTFDEFEKKLETKQLWAKANRDLLHYLDKISKTHPGALNSYRSEIGEAAALVGKTEPTGIYRMTTPTGGGKTLSGMRFALEHAMAQKKEKIFYITHYLTVLEQNVNTIREAMPSLQGEILEFHSNVMNEERVESDEIIYEWKHKKNKLLQERWDTPVIFTSMVQFLNTFFHERKSSGRRLHQFANAIILFDEAQSVPTHTVGLFCQAVNFLRRMNSTSVICTATQPHFEVLDYGFDVEWNKTLEIVPDVEKYFEKFKRQRISLYEPTLKNSEEAADFLEERMKNTSSLLMICNTVKAASAIYQEIKARGDTCCYYLSTALCPVHRRVQLKEIRKSLQQSREASGQKVICITTPIIEAGVDISFETVVRSLSGLDSIAQAGGRGNRNKERDIGDLIIVELGEQLEKISYLKEIKAKQGISRGIILFEDDKQDMDLFSQEAMQTFFKKLHEKFNSKEIYKHRFTEDGVSFTVFDILNENKNTLEIKRACNCDFQPFFKNRSDWRTANRNFWVIDEKGVNVLVPYKNLAEGIDGAALIAELESGASLQEKVKLLRSAQQFMITLFDHEKKSLGALGALRALGEFTGVYVLDEQFYSMDSGYQGTKDTQELSFLDI